MNEFIKIKGKVIKTVYRNENNYYSVVVFECSDENEITIVGNFPALEEDNYYFLEGYYCEHYKYGIQFQVVKWEKALPNSSLSVINFLSGPLFKGIGKKLARYIVDNLGENVLELIKEDYTILNSLNKLTNKKKKVIIDTLNNMDNESEKIMQFFMLHGINAKNSLKIEKKYGYDAVDIIKDNPYRLVYEIEGIGFKTADKIGASLNIKNNDERRVEALLFDFVNKICMNLGDTFVIIDDLKKYFNDYLDKQKIDFDFDLALNKCLFSKSLILEENRVYLQSQFVSQEYISRYLADFPFENLYAFDKEKLSEALLKVQDKLNINYDATQMMAIKAFFENDLTIITGGPGTGKTTIIRGIVEIFKTVFPYSPICCCAPTGRAAKRLSELTETDTNTIHSLLKWDLESNTFNKNEDDPLLIDLLIIDEFSMVDNWLFFNLLKAAHRVKKICIIGDEEQLPSVGPGCLLKDLIETDKWPVIRLDKIYRQQEGSGVIKLAKDIKNNNVDFDNIKNDVGFYEINNDNVSNMIINIVKNAVNKGYDINDVQVLSCMYKGSCGIDNLNNQLQKVFNPQTKKKKELRIGNKIFRINDKILQLKNQPDDDVYNGDIGILTDIEFSYENENKINYLFVEFDGNLVEYSQENINNITHAYCISIHKSQGSEYPIVIIPIVKQQQIMHEKKLLYTAVTRAKKSVVLIGQKQIFYQGINTFERHIRNSLLADKILEKTKFQLF